MQKLLKHIMAMVFVLIAVSAYAQQDPMFTQYMNNPIILNPAYAGSRGELNFNGIFRKQWVGLEWQPTTTTFSINSPFREYNVGVGATFINDKIGPMQQTGIYLDYAYHLDFSETSRLSLGMKIGTNYFQKDLLGLTSDEYDPWVAMFPITSKFLFNTGVGAYYYTNRFFVGASIPKLIRNSFNKGDYDQALIGREERHYFFTSGAIFDVNPILKLKPTAMLRMVNGAPASFEITGTAIYYERFWFGMMYRINESIAVHARVQVNATMQIGYSYDIVNSRLREYSAGTHEVFLSYSFSRRGQRILSPRYF